MMFSPLQRAPRTRCAAAASTPRYLLAVPLSCSGPSGCDYGELLFLRLKEDTRRCCDNKNKRWKINQKTRVTHFFGLRDPASAWRQEEAAGVGETPRKGKESRSKARGAVRGACELEYSLVVYLDFGVKALKPKVSEQQGREAALPSLGCFPGGVFLLSR